MLLSIDPSISQAYIESIFKDEPGNVEILRIDNDEASASKVINAIASYKPNVSKSHLVVVGPPGWGVEHSSEQFKRLEVLFDSKGGAQFGPDPLPGTKNEDRTVWVGEAIDNTSRVLSHLKNGALRSIFIKKVLPRYVGRSSIDPRVVFVGLKANLTNPSKLLSGLYSVFPDNFHFGVGFIPTLSDDDLVAHYDWLDVTNFVTLGVDAHEQFERLDLEHASAPYPTTKNITAKYGILLRELAKHQDNRLDWKP